MNFLAFTFLSKTISNHHLPFMNKIASKKCFLALLLEKTQNYYSVYALNQTIQSVNYQFKQTDYAYFMVTTKIFIIIVSKTYYNKYLISVFSKVFQ